MKTSPIFILIISLAIIFSGCKESDDPTETIPFGNLVVETTITTDGSGLVMFKASGC